MSETPDNDDAAWELWDIELPLLSRVSIYEHICDHITDDVKGLTVGGARLPDEVDDGRMKWVAGGLDGAFGHHGGGGSETSSAAMLHRALGVVLDDVTPVKLSKLYEQLADSSVLDFIDPLIERIVEARDLDPNRMARVLTVRNLPHWHEIVTEGLASTDRMEFSAADQAAKVLGIDTWDHHFARLESGEDSWYFVMQTDDPARIDRVVALAEATLPLDDIATGPASEMGFGEKWTNHGHLEWVVQGLRRFPGKGWPLVRASLRSPVIRSRNMAIKALTAWGRQAWPSDAQALLERALDAEPEDSVRDTIAALLAVEDG